MHNVIKGNYNAIVLPEGIMIHSITKSPTIQVPKDCSYLLYLEAVKHSSPISSEVIVVQW